MTYSGEICVFDTTTGDLINTWYFANPKKKYIQLKLKGNYLWFQNRNQLTLLKTRKNQINMEMASDNMKTSRINVSDDRQFLYFLSEKERYIWKFTCNDLYPVFAKSLPQIDQAIFISETQFACAVNVNLEASLLEEIEDPYNEAYLESLTKVIVVDCELFDVDKDLDKNPGVTQIYSSNRKIKKIICRTLKEGQHLIFAIMENEIVFKILYKTGEIDFKIDQIFGERDNTTAINSKVLIPIQFIQYI